MLRVYKERPLEEAVAAIARAGYRYTAYLPPIYYGEEAGDAELRALRRTVEAAGIRAVTAWAGNPLKTGAKGLVRSIEQAQVLGLEWLIVSSPYEGDPDAPHSRDDVLRRFVDVMEAVLPVAEGAGVRLDVKPHGGPFGDGPGLAELARRLNHPCFGVSYDPGNIRSYAGLRPEADLPAVARHVRSLCIKDFLPVADGRNAFPPPGKGEVDWPVILGTLGEAGFRGYGLLEVLRETDPEALDREVAAVRRRFEEWITDAGGAVPPA